MIPYEIIDKYYKLSEDKKELQNKVEAIDKELKEIKESIVNSMKEMHVNQLMINDYLVSYKDVQSSRLDYNKFKNEYPTLYDLFTIKYSYPLVNVKKVEEIVKAEPED